MTHAELVALNKANAIPGLDRSHILGAFACIGGNRRGRNDIHWLLASKEWRFIANIAIRKSDGFTVTREQLEDTEIPC